MQLAYCVVLISLVFAGVAPVAQEPASSTVRCVVDEAHRREFLLDRNAGQWRLSMRSMETGTRWIRLTLPNAAPELSDKVGRLTYKNANGGRQIDLTVTPDRASLDVWVDYGLEVNIEPDLDPRVDLMNTEGPLSNVTCDMQHATHD
jgi:hypothetical protein